MAFCKTNDVLFTDAGWQVIVRANTVQVVQPDRPEITLTLQYLAESNRILFTVEAGVIKIMNNFYTSCTVPGG